MTNPSPYHRDKGRGRAILVSYFTAKVLTGIITPLKDKTLAIAKTTHFVNEHQTEFASTDNVLIKFVWWFVVDYPLLEFVLFFYSRFCSDQISIYAGFFGWPHFLKFYYYYFGGGEVVLVIVCSHT